MSMRRKSIALSITAVSALVAACAANHAATTQSRIDEAAIYVGEVAPQTPSELYASRYPTSVTQLVDGERMHFVQCGDDCPGATPKSAIGQLRSAVTQRALISLQARRFAATIPTTSMRAQSTSSATVVKASTPILIKAVAKPIPEHVDTSSRLTMPLQQTPEAIEAPPVEHQPEPRTDQQDDDHAARGSGELLDVVTFWSGSAWLSPQNARTVADLATTWKMVTVDDLPPRKLLVAGYTDSWPTKSAGFNEYLARRRAETVRDTLVTLGIPQDAIQVSAHSECCYIADNSTSEGRSKNRRAEIHVL